MRALGAADLTVDNIDIVMCTYLHADSCGPEYAPEERAVGANLPPRPVPVR
jgi:hypothetical protein